MDKTYKIVAYADDIAILITGRCILYKAYTSEILSDGIPCKAYPKFEYIGIRRLWHILIRVYSF